MKTSKILLILISISCLLFPPPLRAQSTKSITISGKIKEANTQNSIPYATIVVIDSDGKQVERSLQMMEVLNLPQP